MATNRGEPEASDELWDDGDEPVKILDAAAAATAEAPLPEELARANEQRQEDEVLALQAIYGDDVVIFDRRGGLRFLKMYVRYELSGGINVSAKLGAIPRGCGALEDRHEPSALADSDAFLYKFTVRHLPPVKLTCLLPSSYPSSHPPHFTITSRWLDIPAVASLCHKLDSIWDENAGLEVMYQWVEWLRSSSLTFLGFDAAVVLGESISPNSDHHDDRAIARVAPLELIVPSLISYNGEKDHELFLRSLHLCEICYSEDLGTKFINLPCKHFFCFECMQTYSQMHVKEGSVIKLLCPNAKCDSPIPPYLLKRMLGQEDYDRWESLMLQRALDTMTDVVYCPRCKTGCLKDEDNNAQCSKCFFNFCALCNTARHVGQNCLTEEERLQQLQAKQKSSVLTETELRKQEELINEMLSIREVFKDAKPCPKCKMAISRTEGCNKMVCQNCGQYFCFRCNKAIDGYDHFGEGCVLFPEEERRIREDELQDYQVVHQIRAQLNPNEGYPCPNCFVLNVKIGQNNHIFCWACRIHYCTQCNLQVKKRAQHYAAPAKCKQFTD